MRRPDQLENMHVPTYKNGQILALTEGSAILSSGVGCFGSVAAYSIAVT